jgi:chromosome segregation ATPase
MNSKIGCFICLTAIVLVGCEKKDQDAAMAQGQLIASKAQTIAGNAWQSARDAASKLSADSGSAALQSAKSQMEALQGKLSQVKAPTGLDGLKLDSVKEEIQRLEDALNIQKLKTEMDEKVREASNAKENAEKTADDVREELRRADAEYRDLQDKLNRAQSAYNDASQRAQDAAKKVLDVAGSVSP